MAKSCKQCDKWLTGGQKCFCNINCRTLHRLNVGQQKRPPRACETCGKVFIPMTSRTKGRFCSHDCRNKGNAKYTEAQILEIITRRLNNETAKTIANRMNISISKVYNTRDMCREKMFKTNKINNNGQNS